MRRITNSMMQRRALIAAAVLVSSLVGCRGAKPDASLRAAPADGRALLQRMHDRYDGKWFHTLTFVQKTTARRPDGSQQVSTWYESLSESRLRIDVGDPALGNGVLYTADSMYVIRGGKTVRSANEGNPFLPLIAGVFIQPVSLTISQLAPYKFDLSKIYEGSWQGRATWVVGASSSADTTSPQFWIDKERLIVMRFVMPLFSTPSGRSEDVRLDDNVQVGGGWLATRIRMIDAGVDLQTEEYTDWHTGVSFPPTFFQAEHWNEGTHWARGANR